ncbi:acyl-CoA dehydrogenase family protein [Nocardiopsis tropica]|uniref:Acyl-CoA dehydrogenase family protein n=1 Tax=Nocardiopsis tropica TaxID=109330 RepID=A0ABU7KU31_9ACTN|nr:acyl-CoA dehydrogenase family protein [Nocardiopsis umidischolae]MEE2052816.1 acyl-CoA dehydrogenase family protein [Nocardiopsis umidischolae]
MDFDPTPEQRERVDRVTEHVRNGLAGTPPRSPDEPLTRDEWRTMAEAGLTGACLPASVGGGGLGALDTALLLEAAGAACDHGGLPFAVAAHLLACGVPLRDFGRGDAVDDLLRGMASGEVVAGNAVTEDGAGSDVNAMAATAERDSGGYVLNGTKSFVSNAPEADVLVTYAVTDASAGFLGITAFAVPRGTPGITVGPTLRKTGLHACPAARVTFTDCRVPGSLRLGAEGQGGAVFQFSMAWERACLPAVYLGSMEDQLGRTAAHVRGRRQFGRSLGGFQAVSHRVAAMRQRLDAARLLLYRACWLLDRGRPEADTAIAMSKVAVTEAAVANGLDALQLFGASGYLTETGVEQRLRDALPGTLVSGTSEIQREVIARGEGL